MHIMPRAKECKSGSSTRIGAGMVPSTLYTCMHAHMGVHRLSMHAMYVHTCTQVLIDIPEA